MTERKEAPAALADIHELQLPDNAADGEPLVESVHRALRDAIVDGRLKANQKLAQIPLAKQLGISRTPVRDALQRLAQEGLVSAVSWRGFVVSEFSIQDVVEIYDVRLALEPLAARRAIGHHNRVDIARLADNCDLTADTPRDEIDRLYELNREFHAGLVSPCDNAVLIRILDQLWEMPASLRLFHEQAVHSTPLKETVGEHRQILEALEQGDAELLERRVTDHIRNAREETVRSLKA